MKTIQRIDPLSAAKLLAILDACIGLIAGLFLALFSVVGGAAASEQDGSALPWVFGGGLIAIVVVPLVYALVGFVSGLVAALLYNFVARTVGGLKIELS